MNLDPQRMEPSANVITEPALSPANQLPPAPSWNILQLFLFRFLFLYWIVTILPFPVDGIRPYGFQWVRPYLQYREEVVKWVATNVFNTTITVMPNGSGDTTFNYIQLFTFAAFALAGALLWSAVDFRRRHYRLLHDLLRIYGRFWLASVLITYGAVKVIKSQFPDPALDRLLQPIGDASPMGLAWTFMGYSEGYNLFSGLGEMIGGLLLTTRHTTLLGALVSFAVMLNVVMINYCFDVPVKIFSSNLLLMCVFLAAPDMIHLIKTMVLNRPSTPRRLGIGFERWWWLRWPLVLVRTGIVAWFVYEAISGAMMSRDFYKNRFNSPFFGIWLVDEFEVDGKVVPQSYSDQSRWRRVVFDYPNSMNILVGDRRDRYQLKVDFRASMMVLTDFFRPGWQQVIQYSRRGSREMHFKGELDGKPFKAKLTKEDIPEFRLKSREFNWINEYPFNR